LVILVSNIQLLTLPFHMLLRLVFTENFSVMHLKCSISDRVSWNWNCFGFEHDERISFRNWMWVSTTCRIYFRKVIFHVTFDCGQNEQNVFFYITGIHLRQLTILSTSSNSFSSLFAEWRIQTHLKSSKSRSEGQFSRNALPNWLQFGDIGKKFLSPSVKMLFKNNFAVVEW